jgi:hypothetical protein
MRSVTKREASKLIGKHVYAVRKDGSMVTGKLVRIQGTKLHIQPSSKGKKVSTKAILPLVLFDLLAIGTGPFGYGYGGGFYGGPGYGAYGNPYGYDGFW